MATEPERSIEKLLRACAKKRRDEAGAPLELHPATRRLLQGEVARRFRRDQSRPRSALGLLALFRLRLAESLVIVALVGVLGALLLPPLGKSNSKATLAMNGQRAVAPPWRKPVPGPTVASTGAAAEPVNPTGSSLVASFDAELPQRNKGALNLNAGEALADKDRAVKPGSVTAPETVTAAAQAGTAFALAERPPTGGPMNSPGENAAPPAFAYRSLGEGVSRRAPPPPADKKEAPGAFLADESKGSKALAALPRAQPQTVLELLSENGEKASFIQRFSQVVPSPKAKADALNEPVRAVLTSFQMEQAGREVRVIDSDGSVYTGLMEAPDVALRGRAIRAEGLAAAAAPAASAGRLDFGVTGDAARQAKPVYFFRVTGTNRSLRQPVIFSGDLLALTNAATLGGLGGGAGDKAATFLAMPAQTSLAPLLNSRISGKVIIGDGKAIEINAVPAKP